MSFLDLILHLWGFVAPALFVALGMALVGSLVFAKKPFARGFVRRFCWQWAINCAAGSIVLLAGLVITGQDGRMLTYAALVVVVATTQWALTLKS